MWVVVLVLAFFVFAPVVSAPIQQPKQEAFLGSLTGYESLGCSVAGVGAGYWTAPYGPPPVSSNSTYSCLVSFRLGCPPRSYA